MCRYDVKVNGKLVRSFYNEDLLVEFVRTCEPGTWSVAEINY